MRIALLFLAASALTAQTFTALTGPIYTPVQGILFSGTLQISSQVLVGTSSSSISAWVQTITVTNGSIGTLALVPNDTAQPTGTYYVFKYTPTPGNGPPTSQYCTVPTSATPVSLGSICVPSLPSSPSSAVSLSQLTQSGATVNQMPCWSGTSWAPGNCGGGGGSVPGSANQILTSNGSGGYGIASTGFLGTSIAYPATAAYLSSNTTLYVGRSDGLTSGGNVAQPVMGVYNWTGTSNTSLNLSGGRFAFLTDSASTGNIGNARGLYGIVQHSGSGTITTLSSVSSTAAFNSTAPFGAVTDLALFRGSSLTGAGGTIGTLAGFNYSGLTNSAFTITNHYGVYVGALNYGTNKWAFYALSDPAYFGGGIRLPSLTSTILKTSSSGDAVAAVAGTDYAAATNGTLGQALTSNGAGGFSTPVTLATVATTGAYSDLTGKPTIPTVATTSSVLKGNGSGGAIAATSGTDFAPATNGTSNQALTSNGAGGFSTAVTLATVATSGSASDLSAGTLPAGRMPALTGDVTSSAGSTATTVSATHLASALPVNQGGTGTTSTLTGLVRGSASAMTASEISGDCATSGSNSITCTKTSGVAFASSATTDTTNAANISTGTLPAARLPALTGDVTSSAGSASTTVGKINGVSMAGLATGIVKNTTGTGAPSIAVAADFPTLNQNTSGNAATATALATTPTLCSSGQAPTGILANGNATGCASASGGGSAFAWTPTTTSVGTSQTVIADSGALPALAAGKCFAYDMWVTGGGTLGDNIYIWYGTAAATGSNYLAGYICGSCTGSAELRGNICNAPASQTSQNIFGLSLAGGNPAYFATTGNQTTSSTSLHVSLTDYTNSGTHSVTVQSFTVIPQP